MGINKIRPLIKDQKVIIDLGLLTLYAGTVCGSMRIWFPRNETGQQDVIQSTQRLLQELVSGGSYSTATGNVQAIDENFLGILVYFGIILLCLHPPHTPCVHSALHVVSSHVRDAPLHIFFINIVWMNFSLILECELGIILKIWGGFFLSPNQGVNFFSLNIFLFPLEVCTWWKIGVWGNR